MPCYNIKHNLGSKARKKQLVSGNMPNIAYSNQLIYIKIPQC